MVPNVVRIECWIVGSYDPTPHVISTVLQLYSGSFLLCFPLFALFFLCFFACFLCFAWFLYFLYFFSRPYQQLTDPTYEPCNVANVYVPSPAYRSYLRTVKFSSCLRS